MMSKADSADSIAQACAIPYRRVHHAVEFCLITSSSKRRWGFPKGIIDPGETDKETAIKEAHEEAGLHGEIKGEPVGTYTYSKWDTTLDVKVFLMEVSQAEDQWLEANLRRRRWAAPLEALELVSQPGQRRLLVEAIRRLNSSEGNAAL